MKQVIMSCLLFLSMMLLTMCKSDVDTTMEQQVVVSVQKQVEQPKIEIKETVNTTIKEPAAKETFSQGFEYHSISKDIEQLITGVSWKQNNTVQIEDLCYVKVKYWGYDEKAHIGELIVNKDIGQEVIEIFKELYDARFPIMKMKLIDEYGAVDSKSMEDNNTSAFCYREVEGKPGKLSKHSYGIAIDINPVQNPYVYKEKVSPESGRDYLNRSQISKGMIVAADACYKAFTSRGWTWGGDWKYEKDYQHFQK